MPDFPSRLDYYNIARDYVVQRAKKIDPAQIDVEGSDANLFCGVSSVLAHSVTKQLAYRTAALTLDGSEDEDVDRYALDRYGRELPRKGASAARGTITVSRTTTVGGAGTVPSGTKVQTLTGIEYVTTTSASFGASDLTSSAQVRAVQAGKSTQVVKESIQRFSNTAALFDKTLTCLNAQGTAGGEDAEDDEAYKARIRDFWRSARRGILGAIETGALTVAGVVTAQAIEVVNPDASPARLVTLYISDSSGVANEALAEDVSDALLEYRAGGIQVLISTSLPLIVDIELNLAFRANVNTRALTENVKFAVVAFVNSLPVNGTLYVGELYSMLSRYKEDGLIINQDSIVAPVGDLVPDVGQTIRTTLANVVVQ